MIDTPKRKRWFQLHLSTTVVVMFVAAGLVLANTTTYRLRTEYRRQKQQAIRSTKDESGRIRFHFARIDDRDVVAWGCPMVFREFERGTGRGSDYVFPGLLLNLAVMAVGVGVGAWLCEWFVRRRYRQQKGVASE